MNEFQQKKVVGMNIFQLIIDLDLSKDLLELFWVFLQLAIILRIQF